MLRLFAAIPIPDATAEAIARVQNGLEGAKWSPRDNLHLTLRFLGDLNSHQSTEVDAALAHIKRAPFDIDIAEVGYFGGDAPHAMWLGIKPSAQLLDLQKQCELACRRALLPPDPRSYTPHVTICYLPRHFPLARATDFQSANNLFKAPSFNADRFYLYASRTQGSGPSHYEVMAEYPLLQ